jgi:hypothetical protein
MDVSVNALLRTAALLLLLVTTSVLAERVQYRWIDENGAVIFTDAPPNGVVYQVFRDGIGREIVEPETNEAPPEAEQKKDEPVPLYTEQERQDISDRLLLLKYRNEQEIIEERDAELDHLKYDFKLLEDERKSLVKSLHGLIRSAADSQRAQHPVEEPQRQQIEGVRDRLRNNEGELGTLEKRSDTIRAQFELTLERYRFLSSDADTG